MTQTKTVSAERLEYLRDRVNEAKSNGDPEKYMAFITVKQAHEIGIALAELLASRTQEPAEWHIGAQNDGLFIIDKPPRPSNDDQWHDRPYGPDLVIPLGGISKDLAQQIVDAHNTALRAASIPKPGVKGSPVTLAECPIGLFYAGGELCLKTEYGDNNGRIDAYIVSSGEFFWGGTSAPQEQRKVLVQPFELSPSTSEGEAVAPLRDAIAWIVEAPHDEHCFTNDPNPDACRCICGKDAILDRLYEAEPVSPLPVGVTSEWRTMESAPLDGKHCLLAVKDGAFVWTVSGAYQGGQWNAVHQENVTPLYWMPAKRLPEDWEKHTATLSPKPGEE